MKNLYNQFTDIVTNYKLEETAFSNFCLDATQEEFLFSQQSFFYAVQSFPQMLSILASKIESSENRLLVIENLWEEHGKGNKNLFHTETYKEYLKSLGHSLLDIKKHNAVNFWIKTMMEHNSKNPSTSCEYAIKLCAIEFIYTKICILLSKTIQRKDFNLYCTQTHYDLHAKLDLEHAKELFDVAMLEHKNETENNLIKIFHSSISDFVLMLNQLSFLTTNLVKTISKEKIAFYYSRESSKPELECLIKIKSENKNILIICSGGEHLSNISKSYPNANIYAYDINQSQLDLAGKKINGSDYSFNSGKFELIFKNLTERLFLNKYDSLFETINKNSFLYSLCNQDELAIDVFKDICDDIFSNKNLEIIFTDNATKYSSKFFSEHFFNILFNNLISYYKNNDDESFSNLLNILGIQYKELKSFNNIKYIHGDTISVLNSLNLQFDLISISNIGDWMDLDSFINIIFHAKKHLNNKGYLISRKLLGDYNLCNVMHSVFGSTELLKDETQFYSEVIAGKKTILGDWI